MVQDTGKNILSNNISNKKIECLVMGILVSTLCVPVEIRVGVLGKKIGLINYLAIICISLLICINYKNVNKKYSIYIYIMVMYYLVTLFLKNEEMFTIIKVIMVYILPLLMIGINIEKNLFIRLLKKIINLFNFLIILITILGLLEFILKIPISILLSNFMTPRMQELIQIQQEREVFRLYSFMGHPLFNTQLYLMFFVLNNIYTKYFGKILNQKIVIIISIIGIGMTASKTGLILILLSIILVTHNKSYLKKFIFIFCILIIIVSTGIFDNTLQRFAEGSLTSGRSESWNYIIKNGIFPIKFFSGYGHEFTFKLNNYFEWASAAYEYPFRMFALEFGRLMSILIYIPIGLIPTFILLKRKQIYLFISYIIIFIDINTYNGLAVAGDHMLLIAIFIFIILNISKILESKESIIINNKV